MIATWSNCLFGGGAPPAPSTSYANAGGTGNRTGIITIANTGMTVGGGTTAELINGTFGNTFYFNFVSLDGSQFLRFDFGSNKVIDEFKWYQDTASNIGTYTFQGSADGTTWTAFGDSFVLGSSATQTIPVTNSAAFRYYRLLGTTGLLTNVPYCREIEFKIS